MSCSSLILQHSVNCWAGVIDSDYQGNVHIMLYNFGSSSYIVQPGVCIAQLILLHIITPPSIKYDSLTTTAHQDGGFGSTDNCLKSDSIPQSNSTDESISTTDHSTNMSQPNSPSDLIFTIDQSPEVALPSLPYNIYLSMDPFDHHINFIIDFWSSHPTLGLQLVQFPACNHPQLHDVTKSTSAACLPMWCSM